jgi:aldehyde dehydrogenase (NAD+)/retinal dehydrogenase
MPNSKIQSVAGLTKLYINGSYVESKSGQKLTLYNPSDGSVVSSEIPVAGQEDVDAAVAAAEKAFHGPWSKFTGAQRSACLRKLAELLDEEDTLLNILTLDTLSTGNPVSLIPTREKNYIMSQLLYYGEQGSFLFKKILEPNTIQLDGRTSCLVTTSLTMTVL